MKYLIRIIALTLAGYGLYVFVPTWRFLFDVWVYKQILQGDIFCITGFAGSIFYVLMIVSAYLLYMFKKQGRIFSIVILMTQLSLTFTGLIRFWWLTIYPPELPPELQSVDINPEMVASYSIYPVCFIGFMNIIFIICLVHKKVAREYNRISKQNSLQCITNRLKIDALKPARVSAQLLPTERLDQDIVRTMSGCIGLITRCKDEYFISEFVDYYLTQGIDHIYIIDDDSLNKSIYDQLLDNAKVTIVYGRNVTSTHFANTIYDDIKNKYEWLIYVDVDEFITTRKNLSNTIKDELMTTFKNVDCIKIPWVMMGCNGAIKSPRRILTTNITRWNHDKKHPNPIHKFRCRYDEIEVKCIFRPKYFDAIWDHHPKKNNRENLRIVSGINCNPTVLSPFIENLRETSIKNGHLLCYHYRIISVENSINKLKTNRWYMENKYTLGDLMSSDHNEVEDTTLRDKWVKLEHDRSR